MSGNFAALRAAEDALDHLKFSGCEQPRCPHCGQSIDISENELWRLYEEGEHDLKCPYCNADFSVSVNVSYSFSTDDQDMDEEDSDQQAKPEVSNG